MKGPIYSMYIIVWYPFRKLAMARDKGKVLTVDITQIPKSMNIDVAKWMHYLSAMGVNFVNPYEDGWDIPGREGGKASQFNQIAAADLTMANVMDQYINLMAKIEDMIGEISGISSQRQGAIASTELVGNVERSVVQSAHITEPLFWKHNLFKREMLKMLLETSKVAWKDGNKTSLNYILDDATRAFLTLTDDFFYEDFDIFVSDSTRDQQIIEQLKNLMQPAMQNGASLLDVAEIITLDNATMIKAKLEEIESRKMEQQQVEVNWYSNGPIPKYKSSPALYPSLTSTTQSHSTFSSSPVTLYDSSTLNSSGTPASFIIVTNPIFLNDFQHAWVTLIVSPLVNGTLLIWVVIWL